MQRKTHRNEHEKFIYQCEIRISLQFSFLRDCENYRTISFLIISLNQSSHSSDVGFMHVVAVVVMAPSIRFLVFLIATLILEPMKRTILQNKNAHSDRNRHERSEQEAMAMNE